MTPHVWIPASTSPERRALLPAGVAVHNLPGTGPLPARLGPGQFLVTGLGLDRLLEIIPRLDDLRVIQTLSAGVDSLIDRLPPGVILCDGSGIHDVPVAEWVVMTLLAVRHNLARHFDGQRSGHWNEAGLEAGGDDLEGATVLIVGYGSIGRAVEARLHPFQVRLLRVARHAREGVSTFADLPVLLPRADVVVILLPLTAETLGLVDATFMSQMHEGALLVNASRGPIVDTRALITAVLDGRIVAALDVTDPEPLPDGHPLWAAPGVLITPHVAGWVRQRDDRAWQLVVNQVGRFVRGEQLLNVVHDGY
jgi:phosphoglycerate dehydrogenase-like enzyme